MKMVWKRLAAGALALALCGSLAVPAWADEVPELPVEEVAQEPGQDPAQLFSVTVGSYTPKMAGHENIQKGGRYTLIALPVAWAQSQGDSNVATLTPAELAAATGQALFMGSAVATADGEVTFEDVRLRTADAAVYYVTGPGLATPLYEATSTSTMAYGTVYTDDVSNHSATISLVDAVTGYRYGKPAQASASGSVSLDSLAPGTYNILVTKPGYLPTTLTAVSIPDKQTTLLSQMNLSSVNHGTNNAAKYRIGDVDNNGTRDMADLAALLLYYGRVNDVPQGVTADLNGDGGVDQRDVSLLLTAAAMPTPKDITTGTAENVTGAKVTVTDTGAAAGAALRSLSLGVETTATVSAAAFSITYRADAVQPLNDKGGLVSPVDGGTLASCLVPASGVTARLTRWSVAGETVTLSVVLTSDSPRAAGELAKFYYRPVSGNTASFYSEVFALSHAVAVVGKDTVITDQALTYPGCDSVQIAALTIDQQPAAGESAPALILPAAGRTAVLPLSATGRNATTTYPDLPGVVWDISRSDGKSLDGISVERGLLTVTSEAALGSVQVTASRDGVTSQPLTVELKNAPPVATTIQILKDGQPITRDEAVYDANSPRLSYAAQVLDQYGQPLAQQPELSWFLVDAPEETWVSAGGIIGFHSRVPTGVWEFRVVAQTANGIQGVFDLELTVPDRELSELKPVGPDTAVIPAEGEDPLILTYTVGGVSQTGDSVAVAPVITVSPADQGVSASQGLDGSYTVAVTSEASAEQTYYVIFQEGDVSNRIWLKLTAPMEEGGAAWAAIFYGDELIENKEFTVPYGTTETVLTFAAKLLDREGRPIADQPTDWQWVGGRLMTSDGVLTVGAGDMTGVPIDLNAKDPTTGLWARAQVRVRMGSMIEQLRIIAPESLTIPTGATIEHILGVEVRGDAQNPFPAVALSDLDWSVTTKGGKNAPAGVSVEKGVLIVTATAVPGDITVTVSDKSGTVTGSADITLAPAGAETSAFVLYRQIIVDGKTVEESAPVTASGDALNVKEGQGVEIRYTPMLVNQVSGTATAIRTNQVQWIGGGDSFIVDGNAENGVYTSNLTAIYNGQLATAAATVSVYPNVTGLSLDFGEGKNAPPYEFTVPNRASKTYTATVMAQIKRGGATQTVPLNHLGLSDYGLDMATALTGLYATVDKAAGTMTFTIDPVAVDNPTSAPSNGDIDIRYIQLQLDCFPGETQAFNLNFYLVPDTAKATQAVLRRGVGAGTSFAFDTPKEDNVTVAPGVFSNCYALELLDQYKSPVVDETVTWTLTVPDELVSGGTPLVSIVEPGDAVTAAYPSYASIRRLRILSGAPVGGPYDLVLTASAAGFTCTRHISLTVRDRDPDEGMSMTVSGVGLITIPIYYAAYNSTQLNNATATGSFAAVLLTGAQESNEELSAEGFRILWTVTDPEGNAPAGVSIKADQKNAAYATLTVDRTAKPTGSNKKRLLTVTATVVDTAGTQLATNSTPVELARDASLPLLMRIRKNGVEVTRDSVSLAQTDSGTSRDYQFYLVDQYNQPMTGKNLAGVSWSISGSSEEVVKLTKKENQDGSFDAHVEIKNPGYAVNRTVYLTAAISVDEPMAPNGKQVVSYQLPITISIAGTGNGGGGGGGGGGLSGGDTSGNTTAGTPATISVSGNTAVTTNQGTAATRTYSFTLRDKDGKLCDLTEQNKVTWTVSGLSGGLTFNATTRTLTVPANALIGTYTVRLTARYNSNVQSSINVTVTVKAKEDNNTDPNGQTPSGTSVATVVPVVTQSGTAGTATLTEEQEKALTGSTTNGGTVTIAPSGGNGLTSLSVNLTAATVNTLANQKNQSLKVQTALGTVVLPPAALRGLTGQGGSSVTVRLTSTGGGVQVDFICGSAVNTLPAAVAISVPTSGNVALEVNGDGSQSVLKKAIVQNGRVLTYVDGSTQLKLETRTPAFSDTQNHWAQEAIAFTAARELFQGTSATTFSPNDTMTRSMVVTVLHRLENTPAASATAGFADVAQGTWYTDAVDWANAKGIVQGTANGFKPGDPVTREQLATILYRYAADQGLATSQRASLTRFSDSSQVSTWATEAMQWAVSIGLINGKLGGVLDPTGNASRAEVSAILQRLIIYMAPTV